MAVGSWEIALVIVKWFVLLATAGAIGGAYMLTLVRKLCFTDTVPLYDYLQKCAFTGLLASTLLLLVNIGAINRSGLGGMFDTTLGAILLQSGVGDAWQARALGFTLLVLFTLPPVAKKLAPFAESIAHVAAALALIAAFGYTGHISTLAVGAVLALVVHVLAVFLWVGALYPLLQLSRTVDLPQLQTLMRKFGRQALVIVAVLIVAGVFLATSLLQAPADLLTTAYGRVLLLKLFGVYALLMFAATNKLLLVPRLVSSGSAAGLQKSIHMEWIVALMVLAVTSWLTTNVGPDGL